MMRRRRRCVRVALLAALVSPLVGLLASVVTRTTLGAQEAPPFDAIGDVETRTAVRTLIADAAARGLPTAPLVTKVREGIAKRAAPDRIRAATASLAERLGVAAAALARSPSPDELTAGADALQVGVSAATLREMRILWPTKALTVPLGVLSEMIASGVSHATASKRVRELLRKGATAAQFAALSVTVLTDIAAGLAPDASMELRSKGVLSVLNSGPVNATVTGGVGTAVTPPRPIRPPRK
jgi:hypothetical protein